MFRTRKNSLTSWVELSRVVRVLRAPDRRWVQSVDLNWALVNSADRCFSVWYNTQMWMNAPRTMEDAVNMLPVSTYLTASTAPVTLDTPAMDLPAQVHFSSTFSCFSGPRDLCFFYPVFCDSLWSISGLLLHWYRPSNAQWPKENTQKT